MQELFDHRNICLNCGNKLNSYHYLNQTYKSVVFNDNSIVIGDFILTYNNKKYSTNKDPSNYLDNKFLTIVKKCDDCNLFKAPDNCVHLLKNKHDSFCYYEINIYLTTNYYAAIGTDVISIVENDKLFSSNCFNKTSVLTIKTPDMFICQTIESPDYRDNKEDYLKLMKVFLAFS